MNNQIKRYFSIILTFGALLGLFFPSMGKGLVFLVMPSLFVLMLFTVIKIDFYKLTHSIKKPIPILIALLLSYIVIPAILYLIADLFNLDKEAKFSVMFSALAPTILSAPYFVSIIKGDVEFSFVLSVFITLLAPFLIPLELYYIFGTKIDFPFMNIFESIFIIIFIPILTVYFVKKVFPEFIMKVSSQENIVTSLMFFIFMWAIISVNSEEILKLSNFVLILIAIGIIQEFGVFIFLRKLSTLFLSDELSKSFSFSIAVKNTALTAGVAMSLSHEIALASSIVVLLHVPMFAWIMHNGSKM